MILLTYFLFWQFYFFALHSFSFVSFFALNPSEPPQFIKEPEKHITAEMEKVVDIPCQARGEYGFDFIRQTLPGCY